MFHKVAKEWQELKSAIAGEIIKKRNLQKQLNQLLLTIMFEISVKALPVRRLGVSVEIW